jgi:PST family polysaccharide transporter
LNAALGTVVFPVLARVQQDPSKLKNYFLKAYSLVLVVTIPITILCGVFADDLILVTLGPQWTDGVPILRLLVPAILVFAMINPTGWLLVALGMVGRSLRIALVIAPVVITGFVTGLSYGPIGVALGYAIAMTLWLIPHILWCFHRTVVTTTDVLTAIGRPLFAALVGAMAAFGSVWWFGESLSPLGRLMLGSGVLLLVYAWVLLYVMAQKGVYMDLVRALLWRSSGEGRLGIMVG